MSDILSQKEVVTRKPHRCVGCAIVYPNGTKMGTVNFADGGKVYTSYWCKVCETYWNRHMEHDDELSYEGCLRDEDSEVWEAIKKELTA